jgi:hypothetical protein
VAGVARMAGMAEVARVSRVAGVAGVAGVTLCCGGVAGTAGVLGCGVGWADSTTGGMLGTGFPSTLGPDSALASNRSGPNSGEKNPEFSPSFRLFRRGFARPRGRVLIPPWLVRSDV